jgi:hypothetical protein
MPLLLPPSIRYSEALGWASELHRRHGHGRDPVALLPPIARSMAVSVLIWEDGGTEEQAIAGLLLDAITTTAQTHRAIGERFGETVADLVIACRPFLAGAPPADAPLSGPVWVKERRSRLQALAGQSRAVLLVITAQLAHEARECWLACRGNPALWARQPGGVEGAAWFWLRLHQQVRHALPGSLAIERLAEVLHQVLASSVYGELIPAGLAASVWAARYDDRCLHAEPIPDGSVWEQARPCAAHQ